MAYTKDLAVSIVLFVFALALLSLCVYQLFLEHKARNADGSLKYLFRRVTTLSVLFLVVDRCFSLAMLVDGITPGASRARILFRAGIYVGIIVALEIYVHHSVMALCKMSVQDVPPIYHTVLVYIVVLTYFTFLVFTLIGIAINRIFPIYIYFYIQTLIILVLNITSVYVINKISTVIVQSAKDANVDSNARCRTQKLFRRTKMVLLMWWLLYLVTILLLVWKGDKFFQDMDRPIDYGGADTVTPGSILASILSLLPWFGTIWYAWIPQTERVPTYTAESPKPTSELKPAPSSSGANNREMTEV